MDQIEKEALSLSELLEQDREMVMSQLVQNRAQESAVKALEKETDRLMFRAGSMQTDSDSATQGMLQVLKNALPLVSSVSEAEIWEKHGGQDKSGPGALPVSAIVCGIAGVVCVIAGMTGSGAFGIFRVLWSAAGCALLLLGGWLAGRGRGKEPEKKTQVQQTFLVDPERIWHILKGTMLSADHSLEKARKMASSGESVENKQDAGTLSRSDLAFFSELLENAYARRRKAPSEEPLTEQIETIRYYLHEKGIETEDYSSQSAAWFELLPSGGGSVTIRPALLKDGELIQKGVASAG